MTDKTAVTRLLVGRRGEEKKSVRTLQRWFTFFIAQSIIPRLVSFTPRGRADSGNASASGFFIIDWSAWLGISTVYLILGRLLSPFPNGMSRAVANATPRNVIRSLSALAMI